MSKPTYLFFDIETTGPKALACDLISIGMVVTDENYNILGEREERCHIGSPRHTKAPSGYLRDNWDITGDGMAQATHGITYDEASKEQHPLDLARAVYRFIASFDSPLTLAFHANGIFDVSFLFVHFNRWSEAGYYKLAKYIRVDRYENTMTMARAYNKRGKDMLTQSAKYQKQVDKFHGYLTKDRKSPASPAKLIEWQAQKDEALDKLNTLVAYADPFTKNGKSSVALDAICSSLNIKLDHHNALSDAQVLVPIHKYLSQQLAEE